MIKKIFVSALMALFVTTVHSQQAATVTGEVLVQLEKGYVASDVELAANAVLGILPGFKVDRCVSAYMRIWLFSFDEAEISKAEMLRTLNAMPGVVVAQANHIIAERIIPNDPFFGQQWHHVQAGDHDIDSDLAWDITTGGMTTAGDEIVVCVVETGGADWDQADILPNHWVNENEIPANGLDDDDNGYIDDYDGWNITADNGVIAAGNHGTQVSSMIGSKGDNNTGVTGVNWDVKIMQVQMGGVQEANVIQAYEYPMVMRKLYNQSGGTQGAYVVATNSSWGVDNGQPEDAPLWCAMYDSLGAYGVLSCGATANNNVNIDVVGDLPTACPSEFLLSVTATNNADVRTFSGFGTTHVDLGAPGEDVYLANNSSYGTTSGTSFASPCVAGAIGLIYSAPCNTLVEIASANPEEAATLVKQYIMDGTDAVTGLEDEVLTGGRLNVNSSLLLLMDACEGGTCLAPFAVEISQVPGTLNYTITWSATGSAEDFMLRYRLNGEEDWLETISTSALTAGITGLLACSEYEIQLMTSCNDDESDWGNSIFFETDGCCVNPGQFEMTAQDSTSVTITWNDVMAADAYTLVVTPEGGSPTEITGVEENEFTLTGLAPCTQFTLSVFAECTGDDPANTFTFNTTGCGSCVDLEYCTIESNSNDEFIANVTLGDINHTSGDDGGYILVGETTTLHALTQYTIYCTPGFDGSAFNEYFKVWIDYNADGDFEDAQELAFDAGDASNDMVSGSFIVPAWVQDGSVRMRVGMSYVGSFGGGAPPVACGENDYGETEDYCVTLDSDVRVKEMLTNAWTIYPNPASQEIFIRIPGRPEGEKALARIYNSNGALVRETTVSNGVIIDISDLAPGLYSLASTHGQPGIRFIKR